MKLSGPRDRLERKSLENSRLSRGLAFLLAANASNDATRATLVSSCNRINVLNVRRMGPNRQPSQESSSLKNSRAHYVFHGTSSRCYVSRVPHRQFFTSVCLPIADIVHQGRGPGSFSGQLRLGHAIGRRPVSRLADNPWFDEQSSCLQSPEAGRVTVASPIMTQTEAGAFCAKTLQLNNRGLLPGKTEAPQRPSMKQIWASHSVPHV